MLVFLFVPVLLALFLICERVRGAMSLARYKRQLIAKGEKLTPTDLVRHPEPGENGAPEILAAMKELKEGAVLPKSYSPRMRLTPTGHAIVCFRESYWVDDKKTNDWEYLAADLRVNEQVLGRVRAALAKPVLNNNLDYSQGFKMSFSRITPPKSLTDWFGPATQLALHEGRNRDALENLMAEMRLPQILAEDRIVISELVRIAVAGVVRLDTWEALQADGWKDEDLASLQRGWERLRFAEPMVQALKGELVFGEVSYQQLRKSNEDTFQAFYGPEQFFGNGWRASWERTVADFFGEAVPDFLKKQVYCRIWRFAWSHQDELRYLKDMEQLLVINRSAATNRSSLATRADVVQFEKQLFDQNFYDRLRYRGTMSTIGLSKVVNKAMRAEMERSLVIGAIALKRYSLRHRKFPTSLSELVPEFVSFVPTDYMDGMPLKYRLNANGSFILYSVGEDGKDDGGDANLITRTTGGITRSSRKDFVWPQPALREEVEAYRNKPE